MRIGGLIMRSDDDDNSEGVTMEHPVSPVERDGAVYRVEALPLLPVTFHGGIRENRLARTSADVRTVVPTIQGWAVALLFLVAAAGASQLAWGLLPARKPGRAAVGVGGPRGACARV